MTTFDNDKGKTYCRFGYLAPHVVMSVFVNTFGSSYHGVMIYIPIDSVYSHNAIRYVGCAVTISNKGVMSEFLCKRRLTKKFDQKNDQFAEFLPVTWI